MYVTKADGTTEVFEPRKLVSSLRRAGAEEDIAEHIASDIERTVRDGTGTSEIYSRAFSHLREHRRGIAARYSLKRAVLELGPSGFPFEAYIAELFRAEGYSAKIDQIVPGKCVEHEVDVVRSKEGETTYVEAKFHNAAGFKTDVKTALYVKARMDDIAAAGGEVRITGMLVTNTKFTARAIQYASCTGLELLGWEHPSHKTLHDRIEAARVYPVTALTSLTKQEKMAMLSQKLVLCTALPGRTRTLSEMGVTGKKADAVLEEVGALCVPGKAS